MMRKLLLTTTFLTAGLFFTSCSKCHDPLEGNVCIDPAKAQKNANSFCPDVYDPVCGCDGITYNNACEADRAGVVKYEKGECGRTTNK